MTHTSPPRRIIRFGIFQCDVYVGELHKSGIKVKISDQPFRLLATLLERPGDLVTRQELRERLWPAETFVSFDDALNTAVNKLRAALDDNAENPRFIQTIPRRGYRFVASVRTDGKDADVPLASAAPNLSSVLAAGATSQGLGLDAARPRTSKRNSHWQFRLLLGTAAAAGAFAMWWYTPLPPPMLTRIDQVTSNARIDTPVKPVWDGSHVYYMDRDGDHWNLMKASVGGGDSQRVEAPGKNAMALDFAPRDSKLLLATFEKRDGKNQLWTMAEDGGAAIRLGRTMASAAFSPEGRKIAYSSDTLLWIMDADGTNSRKLAELPGPASWLAWSPDGERLRFTMNPPGSKEVNSIWEISKDGANLHRLFAGWSHPGNECCGSWTPDGRYYIFTSSRGGRTNLWTLRERGSFWRRSPQGPFQLTFGPDSPWGGTPGGVGQSIYFYNGVWREELDRLDSKTGRFSPLLPNVNAMLVSFSRDGQWMAYLDSRTNALFRSRMDGKERVELASPDMNPVFPRWSPDGKWIVFGSSLAGHSVMPYIVPANGGRPEPLLQSRAELRDADWSDDGTRLVVSRGLGQADSDGCELLVVDFATRHAERIPGSDNLAMSRWSPDGRFISATTADQDQLKIWDVAARKWTVLAHGTALGISVWSPDSRYLYFQDLLGKGEQVNRYDVRSESVELVTEFSSILGSGVYRAALFGVTPDGSPVIGFNRGAYDLFAATVNFP